MPVKKVLHRYCTELYRADNCTDNCTEQFTSAASKEHQRVRPPACFDQETDVQNY
jgi:hypothetical protein